MIYLIVISYCLMIVLTNVAANLYDNMKERTSDEEHKILLSFFWPLSWIITFIIVILLGLSKIANWITDRVLS